MWNSLSFTTSFYLIRNLTRYYRILHKYGHWWLDSSASSPYAAKTYGTIQNDETQWWKVEALGGGYYSLQQKKTGRYFWLRSVAN
jgi:hypothetical protein